MKEGKNEEIFPFKIFKYFHLKNTSGLGDATQ
jgi:hypothetical protein